jgi:hypothetical protein
MTQDTDQITALNLYALKGPATAFQTAAEALARRVRDESHPGILLYEFYVNADDTSARALVRYRDAAAWIGHHDIAMGWPEMAALRAAATLTDVTFLGQVSPAIRAWLAASTITARIHDGNSLAAGFRR